jgi:hypothetical protein
MVAAGLEGAEVYTREGKKIGRVGNINNDYFTAYDRGIMTDKEFRVPVSAISSVEGDNPAAVRLDLSEEQLKHGFEFTSGRPNSEFVSGAAESEPKMPQEKQVIRYEPVQPAEQQRAEAEILPPISQYLCDMCDEKFRDSPSLQEHRAERHKAPTGI